MPGAVTFDEYFYMNINHIIKDFEDRKKQILKNQNTNEPYSSDNSICKGVFNPAVFLFDRIGNTDLENVISEIKAKDNGLNLLKELVNILNIIINSDKIKQTQLFKVIVDSDVDNFLEVGEFGNFIYSFYNAKNEEEKNTISESFFKQLEAKVVDFKTRKN
jgi:hypothetical protein